jgi:mevalonate pyrophosphate decarboxylase
VYVGGGNVTALKKGRSKMITINLSEKDFNKIADIIEQRILYYHSLAMNARIVDDEKQFLKQMEKVAFYTRLKTVFLGEKI